MQAAREIVASGAPPSVGLVARRAQVSRITVYNRFGSRAGLIAALAPPSATGGLLPPAASPREELRRLLARSCARWAEHPALFRHLPRPPDGDQDPVRRLAQGLAEADQLRPGCSIKEAEDVIASLTSFELFDRLHQDGRRSVVAVADILYRMAGGILGYHP